MADKSAINVGSRSAPSEKDIQALASAIERIPIVDNHAHPLLKPTALSRHVLLAIFTEADGAALDDVYDSFAFHRGVAQLASALQCPATWDDVVSAIQKQRRDDYDGWIRRCLAGIETILVDDGLDNADETFSFDEHDRFTRSPCRRIVRIEAIAAHIIDSIWQRLEENENERRATVDETVDEFYSSFVARLEAAIQQAIVDENVVGFKSVICYRTGLDVPATVDEAAAKRCFGQILASSARPFRRLQHDALNHLVVHRTAALIRDTPEGFHKKPLQFHTGLGDNDIHLTRASPAHLQDFIRAYPSVPIVLLHAGYPFMRESSYLATVYANVYADIGEVFPFISRDGQETILREILELCPWSKVLWSTDGHWFPETYYLAIRQVRSVLSTVLVDFLTKRDISLHSAIHAARAILFDNANRLYHLDLQRQDLGRQSNGIRSQPEPDPLQLLRQFLKDHGETPYTFVNLSWIDYTATSRSRLVPFRRFVQLIKEGKPADLGITKACFGLLQNDHAIPGVTATGEYRLVPDLRSLRRGPVADQVSVYCTFREANGSPVTLCPRTQLLRAVDRAKFERGISFLVGFEIEFVVTEMRPAADEDDALSTDDKIDYVPSRRMGSAWSSTQRLLRRDVTLLLESILNDLEEAGIDVEQVHPESAPGQFEVVLGPRDPMAAVDSLLLARDIIAFRVRSVVANGRFTLHPKPFPEACGTASHIHLSLQTEEGDGDDEDVYGSFYAGILQHLPALAAFTYSHPASYERVVDSAWAGGRWVTWGSQNRETPLRKIQDSHWELKCVDGMANMYLALAAVLQAGLDGLETETSLEGQWKECLVDPATLDAAGRDALGITTALPQTLEEALEALTEDRVLASLVGGDVVERYGAVKKAEMEAYFGLAEEARRRWVIERY